MLECKWEIRLKKNDLACHKVYMGSREQEGRTQYPNPADNKKCKNIAQKTSSLPVLLRVQVVGKKVELNRDMSVNSKWSEKQKTSVP